MKTVDEEYFTFCVMFFGTIAIDVPPVASKLASADTTVEQPGQVRQVPVALQSNRPDLQFEH